MSGSPPKERRKEEEACRIMMLKDVLIMFRGTRMQPAECRDRRQLGMELHQQLRILDALGQALFLLFQLGNRGAIGSNHMQPTQANED